MDVAMKEEIQSILEKVLSKQDERLLSPILENESYRSIIANEQYEQLMKTIVDHMEMKSKEAKLFRRQLEFYENIICEISRISFSEGMLLTLIEYGEEHSNDVFIVILKPIGILLERVINKCTTIQWVLSMIDKKLTGLDIANHKLEDKEVILLELSDDVETVSEMYREALLFYALIIERYYEDDLTSALLSSLVTILGSPLTCAGLEANELGVCSSLRDIAEKIVNMIGRLIHNPMKFYDAVYLHKEVKKWKQLDVAGDQAFSRLLIFPLEEFPASGLANYFYLLFSERLSSFPRVYSPVYLFVQNLALSVHLVTSFSYLSIKKGLLLIEASADGIAGGSLGEELFSVRDLLKLLDTLVNIIIHNDMRSLRVKSLNALKCILGKANASVLFRLLLHIEPMLARHSGLKSEVISSVLIKNLVHYQKKKLYDVIYCYCRLSNGIESDVVENKETIISSLNLIKYVKLNKRFAHFREVYFGFVEENILKVLESALKISKEHYEAFLQEVQSGEEKEKKTPKLNVKILNAGLNDAAIDREKREVCLKASLGAIELIQWNLATVL